VLALLGLLGGSLGLLTGRCNSRGSEDLGGRGRLSKRCGLDVSPVEVLVLSVPLGGCLLVGATKFLNESALRAYHE
jgi:hypothetical protein